MSCKCAFSRLNVILSGLISGAQHENEGIKTKLYKKEVKQHIKFDKQRELQGAANSSK